MKLFSLFLLLFSYCIGFNQNLIQDGSFEEYTKCPKGFSKTAKGLKFTYWWSPNKATPDCFNSCCKNDRASVPKNIGGTQEAKSGNGYARLLGTENRSEYVKTELKEELEKGVEYYVEFWVSLQDKCMYSTNSLGVFVGKSITGTKNVRALEVIPQIKSDKYITNSSGWTIVSGTFKARGREKYLTIGYFSKEKGSFKYEKVSVQAFAGYYIDDVKLIKVENIEEEESIGLKRSYYESNEFVITIQSNEEIIINNEIVEISKIVEFVQKYFKEIPSHQKESDIIFKIEAERETLMRVIDKVKVILEKNYPTHKIHYRTIE